MLFDHIALGGGVVGFNTTKNLIDCLIKNKKFKQKNYKFAIVDQKIDNIFGGVAYNSVLSAYGYFNNPIRLSPNNFVKFIKTGIFKKKLAHIYHLAKVMLTIYGVKNH